MLSYNLLFSVKFEKKNYFAALPIYFDSVDAFINGYCNFVRSIKYIKNRLISDIPMFCRTLQNNILFFGLNILFMGRQLYKSIAKCWETLF